MRALGVVAVDAVLLQQLPVGVRAVLLRAADDLHAVGPLARDQLQVVGGAGQVGLERFHLGVEADEDEARAGIEARHALQAERRIGLAGVGVRGVDRLVQQLPFVAVDPAVVRAGEVARASAVLATHQGAAMPARIEEGVEVAVAVAVEQQRAAADVAGDEAGRGRELGLVRRVQPAVREEHPAFPLEHGRVGEDAAAHAEDAARTVFEDRAAALRRQVGNVHGGAPGRPAARLGKSGRTNFRRRPCFVKQSRLRRRGVDGRSRVARDEGGVEGPGVGSFGTSEGAPPA